MTAFLVTFLVLTVTGQPVPDASFTCGGLTLPTDSAGKMICTFEAQGKQPIWIYKEGYAAFHAVIAVTPETPPVRLYLRSAAEQQQRPSLAKPNQHVIDQPLDGL